MKLTTADERLLAWSSPPEEIKLVESKDSFLFDSNGKKYIDFIMGWCVGNFGWGNEEILSAIRNFSGPVYVYPGFHYNSWTDLATQLSLITPGDLKKCFRTTGGTDSVETAMKIAMVYTRRKKFLSVEGAYHGNSIAAISIGSRSKSYKNLLDNCETIERPLTAERLEDAEKVLRKKETAALIIEAISTHPHISIPETDFMIGLQGLCRQYGTLLVIDEVATGFGRTGKVFACEHFGLQPDILCMAKGLSGGHAGIGCCITTEEIGNEVEDKVHAYPTYGWHPLSTQVALASLKYFMQNKEELLKNAGEKGFLIHERVSQMKFKKEAEMNWIGLAISVDVKENKYAREIAKKCLDKGLLIEYNGSNLMMFPALNLEEVVCNHALDILEECI